MAKRYVRCDRCTRPVEAENVSVVPAVPSLFTRLSGKKEEKVCDNCLEEMKRI